MLIFIAVLNEDLRLGLQMFLQRDAGMHVIGMAVQAQGLVTQVEASQAELLILDLDLPKASMPDLLAEIRQLDSPPKIVVVSVRPEEKAMVLSAGADAFVSKNAPPDQLLEALRSLKEGSVDSTNLIDKGDKIESNNCRGSTGC
jgi:two-component system, NarL family, invasion response regulator UvrY